MSQPNQLNQIIDSRLKNLSHSSLCLLHSCPRKYQLTKLWPEYTREETVDTSYGKMFGEGLQQIIAGADVETAMLLAISQWNLDIWEVKKEKSFWHCFQAIENFVSLLPESVLANYEVVIWKGKPACELSFRIALPNGFYYRGYIDVLLKHKFDDSLLVVDAKTSGANYASPAKYQNSAQAIGYSIVVDVIAPGTSSFNVMYYEYLTRLNKYVEHTFLKDYLERANWIRDIMLDIEVMKIYDNYESWPMHGESCGGYGNFSCNFLDNCTMQTASLVGSKLIETDAAELDKDKDGNFKKYDIEVTLDELIAAQLGRE